MNRLEKLIASLSPRWAAKRAAMRSVVNYYDAAETGRFRKSKQDKGSANAKVERGHSVILTRARDMDDNYDILSGALDVYVNNVIGTGIQPEPQVMLKDGKPAKDVNTELSRLWDEWIHSSDSTGQNDWYAQQRLIARSFVRDGEVFAQIITGDVQTFKYESRVRLAIEGLESEFCPIDLNEDDKSIRQGIRLNGWGKPISYVIYKSHPGDSGYSLSLKTKEVPANRMLHLKHTKRLQQLRGISPLSTVLNRLDDIKEIDESERVAARVAAAMTAYIKKGASDDYTAPAVSTDGTTQLRMMEMVPGMIFDDLRPGEEVGTIANNRPNNNLIAFRDANVRAAASGIGVSYSSMSKNYTGTYSAQRQELVEQYVNYGIATSYFTYRVCQPVWEAFVRACVADGLIKITGVDVSTLLDASHSRPAMPWIDPKKEAEANAVFEDRGWKSRTAIIRSMGGKPAQVNLEIQRNQEDVKTLGLELTQGDKQPNQKDQPQDLQDNQAE